MVWECNLQMDGDTEAHIPLWEKKKKKNICCKQILIIINHASVYSTVIILFVGSLWGFIPPWKHWSCLHDVQHGLLGLTCKLIMFAFCSASSLLGRHIQIQHSLCNLESSCFAQLLNLPNGCQKRKQPWPRDGGKLVINPRSGACCNITDVHL